MKTLVLAFLSILAFSNSAISADLVVSRSITDGSREPFLLHKGDGRFDSTLAMNLPYVPALSLRRQLDAKRGSTLKFFAGWNPVGEAHVTTITPVEYFDVLKPYLSMSRIEQIAIKNSIQNSDVEILGLGRGTAVVEQKLESTFYLIVESKNLLKIREQIWEEFVESGGNPDAFDPSNFYPHITIGYTKRDLHESDQVFKDTSTLDPEFDLMITD
jgi:hypothetical protein